jgi:hypothetical protein
MCESGGKLGSRELETLVQLMWVEVDTRGTMKDPGINLEPLFNEELVNIVLY